MEVIADLHLHSRYSIATAKNADLEHLDLWGRYKGVQQVLFQKHSYASSLKYFQKNIGYQGGHHMQS